MQKYGTKKVRKYGTLIFMFIMVDPPTVKAGSEVAMRIVNHHLAPNERAGTGGQSGQRDILGDRRKYLTEKRRREKKWRR